MRKKEKKRIAMFGSVKVLVFAALLCAISGVMKLIAPSGDTWRISLENFPILFAGMTLGPVIGGAVGIVSDLLGCLFRGYAINPFITMASMTVGLVSGAVHGLMKTGMFSKIAVSAASAHIAGNVLIKSFALSAMYGMPLGVLLVERIVTYTVTAIAETVIIFVLLKNKAVENGIRRVKNDEL